MVTTKSADGRYTLELSPGRYSMCCIPSDTCDLLNAICATVKVGANQQVEVDMTHDQTGGAVPCECRATAK